MQPSSHMFCMAHAMQGYYDDATDNGLPAGHESLRCLSSKVPRWMSDSQWDGKVKPQALKQTTCLLQDRTDTCCKIEPCLVDLCLGIRGCWLARFLCQLLMLLKMCPDCLWIPEAYFATQHPAGSSFMLVQSACAASGGCNHQNCGGIRGALP